MEGHLLSSLVSPCQQIWVTCIVVARVVRSVCVSMFEIWRKIQTLQPALRQLLPPFWHKIIKILLNFPKYVRPFNDGWRGNDLQWCNRLKIESDNLKTHRNPRMEGPTHQWIYRSEVKREIFWLDSISLQIIFAWNQSFDATHHSTISC